MTDHIKLFFHCSKCLAERPPDQSPSDFQQIEAGWTERGFQVRCKRHNVNIIHVDFEGAQHVADQSDAGDFGREQPRRKLQ